MGGLRILIVEDESIVSITTRKMLERRGYAVAGIASTGEEAIAMVRERVPDLILMDIMLNGRIDGIAASREIRAFADVPVVFMTAYSDQETLERAKSIQPYGYLVKPVGEKELHTTIEIAHYKHDMERKLRSSEERYRQLFTEMLDGYALHEMIYDEHGKPLDYRFISINPAFEKLTGLTAEGVIGRTVKEVLPGIDRFWIDTYGRVALTGQEVRFDQFEPGLGRYYQVYAFRPMKDQFVAVFQDVTDRVKANEELKQKHEELERANLRLQQSYEEMESSNQELQAAFEELEATSEELIENNRALEIAQQELEETNERMSALLGALPDILFETDGEGRICDFRAHDESTLYLPPEEFLGKKVPEVLPPHASSVIMEAIEEACRTGSARGFSYSLPIGSEEMWFELTIMKKKGAKRREERCVVLVRDITQRKRADEALREREVQYRTLFETMTQGVVYQSPDGRITGANPAAQRILGLSLDEMRGKTSHDPGWRAIRADGSVFPGEEHPAMRSLRTGREMTNEFMGVYNPAEERYRWIIVDAVPQFRPGETVPWQVYTTFTDITERKRVEEALRESEELFSTVVHNISTLIGISSVEEGVFREVNDTFLRLTGFSRDEVIGRSSRSLNLWVDEAERDSLMETFRSQGRVVRREVRFRKKDGGVISSLFSMYPLVYQGRTNLLTEAVDITEWKQAEREQARMAGMLEASLNEIYLFDAETLRFRYVSGGALKNLGYTTDQLHGMTPLDLKPEFTAESFESIIAPLRERRQPSAVFETHHRRADGSLYPVEVHLQYFDRDSESLFLGVIIDVTERKRAELALRESDELVRQISDTISEVFYVVDRSARRFIYMSPAYETIWGRPVAEVLEDPYSYINFVHPDDRGRLYEAIRLELEENVLSDIEYRIIRPDGAVRWIRARDYPVYNELGELYRAVGVAEDITERKLAQEKIRTALAERETLLRELYHRTKNNMQVICSMLDLQADHVGDERLVHAFKEMGNRIRSMALVHQKLYQSMNLSSINLGDYTRELVSILFDSYNVSPDRVSLSFDLEDVMVSIDVAIPCGLIVNELVSNSLKHAFPGEGIGAVVVSLQREPEGDIVIGISDNGIGVHRGFNFRESESLGIQTVITLAEQQLGGAMETVLEKGVSHRIRFREKEE
ncbi:MAG: PAS domain S-box protein [Spirochaetes bacterium]|nr:PAS domain S-box protein [Spirochaetota bacterium]